MGGMQGIATPLLWPCARGCHVRGFTPALCILNRSPISGQAPSPRIEVCAIRGDTGSSGGGTGHRRRRNGRRHQWRGGGSRERAAARGGETKKRGCVELRRKRRNSCGERNERRMRREEKQKKEKEAERLDGSGIGIGAAATSGVGHSDVAARIASGCSDCCLLLVLFFTPPWHRPCTTQRRCWPSTSFRPCGGRTGR